MKDWTIRSRPLTVADLDPLLREYRVAVCTGGDGFGGKRYREIGSKANPDVYRKPAMCGTNKIPWDQRNYKAAPPWMSREVVEISKTALPYGLTLVVKEKKK